MEAYLLLLGIPASLTLARRPGWLAYGFLLTLFVILIGLRDKVGMDWNNYLAIHNYLSYQTLLDATSVNEPGFALLAWMSEHLGFGIYGTNFVAAIIFSIGLFALVRTAVHPWMALVAATPYLVVVIAMSASRQSIAIGIFFYVVAQWKSMALITRALLIVVAASFHLSAAFLLVFIALESRLPKLLRYSLTGLAATVSLYFVFSTGHMDYYESMYLGNEEEQVYSSGALMHVLLHAIPAAFYLMYHRLWSRKFGENKLLTNFAILSLLSVPAALFFSTAADRMSLYLFVVPILVWAATPALFPGRYEKVLVHMALIGIHFAILITWLLTGNSARAWLPYDNLLF